MIPIQNVYYMLSYAFQVLNEQGYKNIATEQFHNTAELMAAILEKGIALQLKRGLGKEYIPQVLQDAGKITAEIAKAKAETEFEKYRVIQDRLFMSDFDKYMLELEENAKK